MNHSPFDVLLIGGGAAGLSLALRLAPHARIALVTKGPLPEGATLYAQGGISAVWDQSDSIASHIADTLNTGAGLCDEEVVRFTVERGRGAIQWLIDQGVPFTREPRAAGSEDYHLTREGAHSHRPHHRQKVGPGGKSLPRRLSVRPEPESCEGAARQVCGAGHWRRRQGVSLFQQSGHLHR